MSTRIGSRIKAHRRVRAGDLVAHEWNFRLHSESQKAALEAIDNEVAFARSLLAYELPDGRLKLIDGRLRRDLNPNMEVDVEILDVTDEEARVLLRSIDPLAALAQTQAQLHQRLIEFTSVISEDLRAAWEASVQTAVERRSSAHFSREVALGPEQFLVLLTCRDERHQVELLRRFQQEGLECKALIS